MSDWTNLNDEKDNEIGANAFQWKRFDENLQKKIDEKENQVKRQTDEKILKSKEEKQMFCFGYRKIVFHQ